MEEEALEAGRFTRAAIDLCVGALLETGRATYEIPRSLAGRHSEGLDCLALLTIDGKGQVAVLHPMFYVVASDYEDGLGLLWELNGELPPEGLPTLVKIM